MELRLRNLCRATSQSLRRGSDWIGDTGLKGVRKKPSRAQEADGGGDGEDEEEEEEEEENEEDEWGEEEEEEHEEGTECRNPTCRPLGPGVEEAALVEEARPRAPAGGIRQSGRERACP